MTKKIWSRQTMPTPHLKKKYYDGRCVVGIAGFEPTNDRVKVCCLAA